MKVRSSKGFFKMKYIKNILFIIFSLFVIISISGCKSASNYIENELNNIQEIEPYKLKPSDPLIVRFSGINDQAVIELVIDEKGYIRLLHIEPILAINLTTTQLEKEIEQRYIEGEIYKNVSVNILMTAKAYYLQGEVIQSGQFELVSGTTLLQAIATARGYSPYANRKKVTVTRQGKITEYNMKEIEKDPSKDIIIEAGDVIKVWTRWY